MGFLLNEIIQMCHCDSVLKVVTRCNIDDQIIQRPASSWIIRSTSTQNGHAYQISSYCPFDYCLRHPSQLNFSNPDSQCQFNRTGVLCGICEEGISTVHVFGTSQCKYCTNYYLFLLLPFTLAGIAVIVFLFF